MTYVVTENCIKCKYTDCVEVCPVDCFMKVKFSEQPDECIDCGVREPECPAEAILPDLSARRQSGRSLIANLSKWPTLRKKDPLPDADMALKNLIKTSLA